MVENYSFMGGRAITMPDIFHAAEADDVEELQAALAEGQRLDRTDPQLLDMNPVHVASIRSSNAFLKVASQHESFDPWARDANLRVAFDHASARRNTEGMTILLDVMYPDRPKWDHNAPLRFDRDRKTQRSRQP